MRVIQPGYLYSVDYIGSDPPEAGIIRMNTPGLLPGATVLDLLRVAKQKMVDDKEKPGGSFDPQLIFDLNIMIHALENKGEVVVPEETV